MSKPLAVLLVDDSETDAKLVVRQLIRTGYSPQWERVETAAALRNAFRKREWDLVISDSSVPRLSALDALTLAKESVPGIPFIVVSGTISEEIAVEMIRSGASDYVTKENLGRLGSVVSRELAALAPGTPAARPLIEAREAERRRIALDLHDQVGQLLVAVRLNLLAAQHRRGRGRLLALGEAKSVLDDAIETVRDFSFELYPVVLGRDGLPGALRWLARRHSRWSGLQPKLEIAELPSLPRSLELACFRIAQEALSNVSRHANAGGFTLELRVMEGSLDLVIRDDGKGFDVAAVRRHAASNTSLGLAGMQQRAGGAGGSIEIDSVVGQGTTVRARLPLPGRAPR